VALVHTTLHRCWGRQLGSDRWRLRIRICPKPERRNGWNHRKRIYRPLLYRYFG